MGPRKFILTQLNENRREKTKIILNMKIDLDSMKINNFSINRWNFTINVLMNETKWINIHTIQLHIEVAAD